MGCEKGGGALFPVPDGLMVAAMTLPAARPALSVVAPCFDEEAVLPEFLQRMGAVLDALPDGVGADSEIVVVDDGSRDGTWAVLSKAAACDRRIVAVRLEGNHRPPPALPAG